MARRSSAVAWRIRAASSWAWVSCSGLSGADMGTSLARAHWRTQAVHFPFVYKNSNNFRYADARGAAPRECAWVGSGDAVASSGDAPSSSPARGDMLNHFRRGVALATLPL